MRFPKLTFSDDTELGMEYSRKTGNFLLDIHNPDFGGEEVGLEIDMKLEEFGVLVKCMTGLMMYAEQIEAKTLYRKPNEG